MLKLNCWQVKKCGREPGGARGTEMGVCLAAQDASANGLNGGRNGGRICWAVAGTFCGGQVQGTFAQKQVICLACEFFEGVKTQEGQGHFKFMKPGQAYQRSAR
jgi:eukaryotic-like serine/threonine-protein kinase